MKHSSKLQLPQDYSSSTSTVHCVPLESKQQVHQHASSYLHLHVHEISKHKAVLTAKYLTIIPRARMSSESIVHKAEGRMGY